MKKILIVLFILMSFVWCSDSVASQFVWRNCLTGGTAGCLDEIDGDDIAAGDIATVIVDQGSNISWVYWYRVYASSSSESSPLVIAPDTNPGTKRWHLAGYYGGLGTFTTVTAGSASSAVLGTASTAAGSAILHNATNAYHFTLLSGVSEADIGWTTPTAAPGGNDYLVKASTAGVLGYTDPNTFATAANWGGSAASPPALGTGTPAAATFTSVGATTFTGALTGNASTASNLSGTPALPDGTTATTQSQADASTKLATTAYVDTGLAGKQAADADLTSWGAYTPPGSIAEDCVMLGNDPSSLKCTVKGANNSFWGVNNAGALGFHTTFTPVLTAAPATDDTYSGTVIVLTAGEALAQWDVVYCKNKAGVHACYKYDSDGTDKLLLPRYMATAAIDADASGTFLVTGTIRNDGWAQTTNQDEGKPIWASATAGGITLTEPITSAAEKVLVGYVLEENKIKFIQPVHYPTLTASFVIPAPAATDDINIMKAPRALNILSSGITCIVQGTTSVTGQIQECDATGASCGDLDSDIVCDADGAVDDGTLTDSSIASGAWLRWKTTSVSGTPTFLTVTFQYRTAGE